MLRSDRINPSFPSSPLCSVISLQTHSWAGPASSEPGLSQNSTPLPSQPWILKPSTQTGSDFWGRTTLKFINHSVSVTRGQMWINFTVHTVFLSGIQSHCHWTAAWCWLNYRLWSTHQWIFVLAVFEPAEIHFQNLWSRSSPLVSEILKHLFLPWSLVCAASGFFENTLI